VVAGQTHDEYVDAEWLASRTGWIALPVFQGNPLDCVMAGDGRRTGFKLIQRLSPYRRNLDADGSRQISGISGWKLLPAHFDIEAQLALPVFRGQPQDDHETLGPLHGYAIASRLEQVSSGAVRLNMGTLYPALMRLEHLFGCRMKTAVRPRFVVMVRIGEKTDMEVVDSLIEWDNVDLRVRGAKVLQIVFDLIQRK
jgi:hypothetical protein